MRIVSLLPSATEIVCLLGLETELVGVTHECDYPPFVKNLPKVTRTLIPHDASSLEIDTLVSEQLKTQNALYTLDMPMLERLKPDLLVTQALCDVCAVAEAEVRSAACSLPGMPRILNLEPMSLEDVFETALLVGRETERVEQAAKAIRELRERVERVTERTASIPLVECPRVGFLEWIDPLFNTGHWNPRLIEMAGGREMLGSPGKPSHRIAWQNVLDAQPEVLFIACCGYSVERTLADLPILYQQSGWENLCAVSNGRIYIMDGSAYFSRPGPRLVDSLEIAAHALHPATHPLPPGLPAAHRIVSAN
jgi:iron complex transport system substrate-binding protein